MSKVSFEIYTADFFVACEIENATFETIAKLFAMPNVRAISITTVKESVNA